MIRKLFLTCFALALCTASLVQAKTKTKAYKPPSLKYNSKKIQKNLKKRSSKAKWGQAKIRHSR